MKTNNQLNDTKTTKAERPVHMVRRGAIAASIWQRQTQTGFAYYEFTVSRAWKSKTGDREGYSQSFFTRNTTDLSIVIKDASRWISEREQEAISQAATTVENISALDSDGAAAE